MSKVTKLGLIVAPVVVLSFSSRFRRGIGRFLCGLTGHQGKMMKYEPDRLSLECGYCGFQTEGWEIGKRR